MVLAGNMSRLWRISPRQNAGVSKDRLVCHHPISQPFTTSDGLKIQVRLRHVLRKDPTISYVEYLTNLRDESWARALAGILKRGSPTRSKRATHVSRLSYKAWPLYFDVPWHQDLRYQLTAHACRNTRRALQISWLSLV